VAVSSCIYTLSRQSGNICSLRLDFELFDLADPSAVTAAGGSAGQCLTDSLTFNVVGQGRTYPTICGQNTGYHGNVAAASAAVWTAAAADSTVAAAA
jgi:hypothetical protein